ncbi:hypothetical protein [Paenibacillus silvisoli]|uniref:hypothetical protein n=1 Tax=Paenibacillus silvisoli TaxID=3110539 RepID=UPI0028052761|nr:hypothetical protein [Paenibacillus silvisoli]
MDDDMILPDDFDSLPADDATTEPQEPAEDLNTETVDEPTSEPTEPAESQQEPQTELQKIKVKFDRQERELSVEEAAALAQKGMNYERAVERARQEARDAYIAEQNYEWNGKPITTEAQYKQALAEQELMNKYADLPDELRQELIESRRDREERAKEKAEREEQAKKDAQVNDFLDYFQRVNERSFDAAKDSIPQEVKDAVDRGESLKTAYMEFHNKELRKQLAIAKQNEANKQKAPIGSVTANGVNKQEAEDDFLRGFNSVF